MVRFHILFKNISIYHPALLTSDRLVSLKLERKIVLTQIQTLTAALGGRVWHLWDADTSPAVSHGLHGASAATAAAADLNQRRHVTSPACLIRCMLTHTELTDSFWCIRVSMTTPCVSDYNLHADALGHREHKQRQRLVCLALLKTFANTDRVESFV